MTFYEFGAQLHSFSHHLLSVCLYGGLRISLSIFIPSAETTNVEVWFRARNKFDSDKIRTDPNANLPFHRGEQKQAIQERAPDEMIGVDSSPDQRSNDCPVGDTVVATGSHHCPGQHPACATMWSGACLPSRSSGPEAYSIQGKTQSQVDSTISDLFGSSFKQHGTAGAEIFIRHASEPTYSLTLQLPRKRKEGLLVPGLPSIIPPSLLCQQTGDVYSVYLPESQI